MDPTLHPECSAIVLIPARFPIRLWPPATRVKRKIPPWMCLMDFSVCGVFSGNDFNPLVIIMSVMFVVFLNNNG